MKEMSFIGVSGFFSSGSSAVVDLLKEFNNTYECNAEIRIIKDPYGISQLEQSLVHHWELLNSSAAIRDFLHICRIYNRYNNGIFSPAGLSYAKKINSNFMEITENYIKDLVDYEYQSDFYYQKIKKPYYRYVMDRIRFGIEYYSNGKIRSANRNNPVSYFSHPTEEQFLKATRNYLKNVFSPCLPESVNEGTIILDQAISTNDTDAIFRYFDDAKLIIVDRDPRDMYVEDLERWRENLDKDTESAEAGHRYVMRHKALREGIKESDRVKTIRFEELINNYDEMVIDIVDFLNMDIRNHVHPKQFLNPDKSRKNIGIWKKYYNKYKDALDMIAESLPNYCND